METTMTHEYPKGVTLDDVWAVLRDVAERQKETDRLMKESREEYDRKMKASREEADRRKEEIDRMMKETNEQMKETDRRMEKTRLENEEIGRRMGYLNNRFGEIAEHLVAPGIVKKFNELGYKYTGCHSRGFIVHDEKGNIAAEVDILMENGASIMAVEVKTKPKTQDIAHHTKRLEILKQHFNKNNDNRKIYGAIAGAIFEEAEKKACTNAGFYAIVQTGDTMKIDVPEGFVPKEW